MNTKRLQRQIREMENKFKKTDQIYFLTAFLAKLLSASAPFQPFRVIGFLYDNYGLHSGALPLVFVRLFVLVTVEQQAVSSQCNPPDTA
jgi:hypothetical protein